MAALWSGTFLRDAPPHGEIEGGRSLKAHFRRERNRKLRDRKLNEVIRRDGALRCEICSCTTMTTAPLHLRDSLFEVHHRLPLSTASSPIRTTLSDLAVLCANWPQNGACYERRREKLRRTFGSLFIGGAEVGVLFLAARCQPDDNLPTGRRRPTAAARARQPERLLCRLSGPITATTAMQRKPALLIHVVARVF